MFGRKKEVDKLSALSLDFVCPLKWKDMEGDDRKRFCRKCEKNVYNISSMTRQEAIDFISNQEERVCLTFYRRKDGKIVTQDCYSVFGWGHKFRRRWNPFAVLNVGLACYVHIITFILGPAAITIYSGIGPAMDFDEPPKEEGFTLDEIPILNPPQDSDLE